MDNCWTIIWHLMAQTTQISVDLIKKNLYFRDGFGLRMNMNKNIPYVEIALIFSPINRRLTSWSSPIAVNFLIWRWMFLNFMIIFYFRVIRVFLIKILALFTLQLLELIEWVEQILSVEERYRKKMNLKRLYFPGLKTITNSL